MMTVGIPRTLAQKVSERILIHLDALQPALRLVPLSVSRAQIPKFEPLKLEVDAWTAQHALSQTICWRGVEMIVTNCRWNRRPATGHVTLLPLWPLPSEPENPSVRTNAALELLLMTQVGRLKALQLAHSSEQATVKVPQWVFVEVAGARPYSLRWGGLIAVVETATEKWTSSQWDMRVRENEKYSLTFSFYPVVE